MFTMTAFSQLPECVQFIDVNKPKVEMNGGEKFQFNGNRNWTDDLPICQFTGCGNSINQTYLKDGRIKESHFDYEKRLYCTYDSEK